MNEQPFVVVEASDCGKTILAVHVRDTEEEAIDVGVRLASDNLKNKRRLSKVRKSLKDDSIWYDTDDGQPDEFAWVISITQAEKPFPLTPPKKGSKA